MLINEVQPKNKTFGVIAQVNFDIDKMSLEYNIIISQLKETSKNKPIFSNSQWQYVMNTLETMVSALINNITEYQQEIDRYQLKSKDADLRNRYRKVDRMKNQVQQLLDYIKG